MYLSIAVVFLILIIVLLEFNVTVCKVVSSDDISKIYNGILEANPSSDVTIIRRQVSTEGTAYRVETSTNAELIGENRDVVLQNWIDPRYLSINNNFTMDGAVELIVVSKAKNGIEKNCCWRRKRSNDYADRRYYGYRIAENSRICAKRRV